MLILLLRQLGDFIVGVFVGAVTSKENYNGVVWEHCQIAKELEILVIKLLHGSEKRFVE